MNKKQYSTIAQAFKNYFKITSGTVWTKPNLHNPIEDIHFETLDKWAVQKRVEAKIIHGFKTYFRGLDFQKNGISFVRDVKNSVLEIKVTAKLKKELDYTEFTMEN